jgi:hypothetical protein
MKANQSAKEFVEDDRGIIFELLIGAVFALVIGYTALSIGVYIVGTVGNSLVATFPTTIASRTAMQNLTVLVLRNTTSSMSSNVNIWGVAMLITLITLPLMAVVVIKKMV